MKNCFRKAGFSTDDAALAETNEPNITPLIQELSDRGVMGASDITEDDFAEVDSELLVSPGRSAASEVIASLLLSAETANPQQNESEEDDCGDELPLVSHYEANSCLQKLRVFVAQRDGGSDLLNQLTKLERQMDAFAMQYKLQPTL